MQALVHFAVGLAIALVALTVVDRPARQEFALVFGSGLWAMMPDGHWVFREFGFDGVARVWRAVHESGYANVFWFHHLIDAIETGRDNLEVMIALAVLGAAVGLYYQYNDWWIE